MTDAPDPTPPPPRPSGRPLARLRALAAVLSASAGYVVGYTAAAVAGSTVPLGRALVACTLTAVPMGLLLLEALIRSRGRWGMLLGVFVTYATSAPAGLLAACLEAASDGLPRGGRGVAEDALGYTVMGAAFLTPLLLPLGLAVGWGFGLLVRTASLAAPPAANSEAAADVGDPSRRP